MPPTPFALFYTLHVGRAQTGENCLAWVEKKRSVLQTHSLFFYAPRTGLVKRFFQTSFFLTRYS
jgi:hypothetical protein